MSWTRNIRFACDADDCKAAVEFWPWSFGDEPNEDGRFKLPSVKKGRAWLAGVGWSRRVETYNGVRFTADYCPEHS